MSKTNEVARVKAATNPFKGDKTLAAMKRRWSKMTPAQRKANVETFRTAAKGKPKGSAPKPAATKPAKKAPVAKTQAATKPAKKEETPPVVKTTPATTTRSGQGPRAGVRARANRKVTEAPAKPRRRVTAAERQRQRRSSTTAQSRRTAARERGLANNRRAAERAARERASKNSVFRSSYRRADDARKKK